MVVGDVGFVLGVDGGGEAREGDWEFGGAVCGARCCGELRGPEGFCER